MAHSDLEEIIQAGPHAKPPQKRKAPPPWDFVLLIFGSYLLCMVGCGKARSNDDAVVAIILLIVAIPHLRHRYRSKAIADARVESLPVRINEVETCERWPRSGWVNVMLEMQSGEHRRLRYGAKGKELWTDRDMGVAHIKANRLVKFHRLRL
ncbi:MAG: hypothetical protein GY764_05795 [Halieaceae bacterium]|nr:hypothetical protein [Halieaceae bacterium]